jgi:hypothetical protein
MIMKGARVPVTAAAPLRSTRIALGALLVSGLGACTAEPPTPAGEKVRPPYPSADAIPGTAVRGTIRGRAFEARDVRLLVDARPGYEQVQIALSAASSRAPCGKLDEPDPPRIWLRRKGAEPVAPGETELSPGTEQAWELHYQLRQDGAWVGSGDAAAILRLRPTDGGAGLLGDLAACFADGTNSCVAGRFEALRCPISIDMPLRGNEPPEQLPPDASREARP